MDPHDWVSLIVQLVAEQGQSRDESKENIPQRLKPAPI